MFKFLLEQSGKKPADLIPIFGQRSHVNEALNGKPAISAAQARIGRTVSRQAWIICVDRSAYRIGYV